MMRRVRARIAIRRLVNSAPNLSFDVPDLLAATGGVSRGTLYAAISYLLARRRLRRVGMGRYAAVPPKP